MPSKPTVVIVPGAWQLPTGYAPFADFLKQSGFGAEVVDKPSTGGTELPLAGLPEDIAAVREVVQPLVDAGKEVVLLTHSAGGVSGSGAVEGLDVKTRKEAGLPGGVTWVVFMAAAVVAKGTTMLELLGGKLSWMVDQGDRITVDAGTILEIGLNDLPPEEQRKWSKEMSHTSSVLFAGVSKYEPWSEGIPCAYILAEYDVAMPYQLQQQMAARLGPDALKITLKAGHCPFLSTPKELLAAVEEIVTASPEH